MFMKTTIRVLNTPLRLSPPIHAAWLIPGVLLGAATVGQGALGPGQVVGWGGKALPFMEPGTRFTSIAAGATHTLAITTADSVMA